MTTRFSWRATTLLASFLATISLNVLMAIPASAANYTNYLLDDSVMRNSATMSSGAIQGFLQTKGSGLAYFHDVEDCGSTSGAHYSYYATYYSCGATVSAAQIIADAGRAYGINPQVILATIQKEESLVTTPNPTSSQLNSAMGYGCPDSSGCSGYSGFFNQIDNGTWQFRTDMDLVSGLNWWGMTPSYYACNGATRYYSAGLKPGNDVVFKDENGTGYAEFILPNAATSTLYCYTPHVYSTTSHPPYSGSYNFVNAFIQWFGSPYGNYGWYTNGYKVLDQTRSVYVDPGQLQPGAIYYVDLAATNTGNAPWFNTGYNSFDLGTTNPQGHSSFLCHTSWLACSRPTTVRESDVEPGQVGHFNFYFQAPYTPGNYREYFKPLAENLVWTNDSDQSLGISVVNPGKFSWYTTGYKVLNQAGTAYVDPGNLAPNTKYLVDIAATNTGTATWTNSGTIPVRLGTANPQGHNGILADSSWLSSQRPVALRESSVAPGQVGHFDFLITTPAATGSYREYYKPLAEFYSWMNDTDQSLGIVVK
jgi:hypothetical protein